MLLLCSGQNISICTVNFFIPHLQVLLSFYNLLPHNQFLCRLISLHTYKPFHLPVKSHWLLKSRDIHPLIHPPPAKQQRGLQPGPLVRLRNSETVARAAAALLSPRAPAHSEGTQPPALCSPPRKTFSSFIIIPLIAILKILMCWLIAGSQS